MAGDITDQRRASWLAAARDRGSSHPLDLPLFDHVELAHAPGDADKSRAELCDELQALRVRLARLEGRRPPPRRRDRSRHA